MQPVSWFLERNALWGFKALNLGSCLSTTVIYQFYIGSFWLLAFLSPLSSTPLSRPSPFPSSSRDTVSNLLLCHLFTITWLFGKVVIDGSACEFNLFSACSQGLCRARFVNPTLQTLEAFASCFINARPHCEARMIHHLIPARLCDIDCFPHYSNMIRTFLLLASKRLRETHWWTPMQQPSSNCFSLKLRSCLPPKQFCPSSSTLSKWKYLLSCWSCTSPRICY